MRSIILGPAKEIVNKKLPVDPRFAQKLEVCKIFLYNLISVDPFSFRMRYCKPIPF